MSLNYGDLYFISTFENTMCLNLRTSYADIYFFGQNALINKYVFHYLNEHTLLRCICFRITFYAAAVIGGKEHLVRKSADSLISTKRITQTHVHSCVKIAWICFPPRYVFNQYTCRLNVYFYGLEISCTTTSEAFRVNLLYPYLKNKKYWR